jgi:NIPSNAP protein
MIVEQRVYRLHTGKVPEYLRIYGEQGRAIQDQILGHMVGWFTANEFGELNRIVHMWAYADLDDRARRRAALAADPGWQAVVAQLQPLIREQESTILSPAPWSPIGGQG